MATARRAEPNVDRSWTDARSIDQSLGASRAVTRAEVLLILRAPRHGLIPQGVDAVRLEPTAALEEARATGMAPAVQQGAVHPSHGQGSPTAGRWGRHHAGTRVRRVVHGNAVRRGEGPLSDSSYRACPAGRGQNAGMVDRQPKSPSSFMTRSDSSMASRAWATSDSLWE